MKTPFEYSEEGILVLGFTYHKHARSM